MSDEVVRHLLPLCREVLEDTPILVLQGARQVGKSTLARQIAGSSARHVTLDDRLTRGFAQDDPEQFVLQNPGGLLVIDEAQRAPELALALKATVDADRRPGRFLLTGSVDLLQTPGLGDSLAGRKETVRVYPFSQGEVERRSRPEDFVAWVAAGAEGGIDTTGDLPSLVTQGGFPEPVKRGPGRRADRWFADYVDTLVQHDATELSDGPFADHLLSTLRWLAAQGQTELVKARLARHLSVSESTADRYLRLLWSMFLGQTFPSWGLGTLGRETRRPKVGLLDTGLASHLSAFTAERATSIGGREYFGTLLEQFVGGELTKQAEWSAQRYRVYHYRHRSTEVDYVVELADGSVLLIEVKASRGVDASSWEQLSTLKAELGDRVRAGVVLHTGPHVAHLRGWLHVLPIWALWRHPAG
ncbi:MAG: ATP-binding protein [Propioniciclava sp.]|uniref:ATP-binding protein n=1 Tax=Propioniciclava sp. TaxID=2038686 RepID=UPI0039E5BF5D